MEPGLTLTGKRKTFTFDNLCFQRLSPPTKNLSLVQFCQEPWFTYKLPKMRGVVVHTHHPSTQEVLQEDQIFKVTLVDYTGRKLESSLIYIRPAGACMKMETAKSLL